MLKQSREIISDHKNQINELYESIQTDKNIIQTHETCQLGNECENIDCWFKEMKNCLVQVTNNYKALIDQRNFIRQTNIDNANNHIIISDLQHKNKQYADNYQQQQIIMKNVAEDEQYRNKLIEKFKHKNQIQKNEIIKLKSDLQSAFLNSKTE